MISILIVLVVGLLCWQAIEEAYLEPSHRDSEPASWRYVGTIVALVVFVAAVLFQLQVILTPR